MADTRQDHASMQERIWANKLAKGFNTTDVSKELCHIQAEIVEFWEAEDFQDRNAMRGELADIAIFTYGLAKMVNVTMPDSPLFTADSLYKPAVKSLPIAVSKFFEAWKRGKQELLEELIFNIMGELEALAYRENIYLQDAIEGKIKHNAQRVYNATAHGHVEVNNDKLA